MASKSTTRPFGTTGRQVASVGQGTWKMDESAADGVILALRRGLDLGLTHIDTAEMYGSGASEGMVGKAIEGRRDEVFLVSKVLPGNASIAAFETLVHQGKILSWGVSNFDVQDLDQVAAIAGAGHPACNQVLCHLLERAIEHAVLPWCRRHGSAVVAYTPFGQSSRIFDGESKQARVLREIAQAHAATPRQVALRFLLRHPEMFVIPKASDISHVNENAGASTLKLSDSDIARIDAAFPLGRAPRELPMI
jgi:diketogulonate reductase-like aldo/keto reductase